MIEHRRIEGLRLSCSMQEGVSLHLEQWKTLCNMSEIIDDFLTRVIEKEPVDWRYHIGDDAYVTIKAPYVCVHIRKHFIPVVEWTYRPTKRGVALHFGEWKELKKKTKQSHCWKKESQN